MDHQQTQGSQWVPRYIWERYPQFQRERVWDDERRRFVYLPLSPERWAEFQRLIADDRRRIAEAREARAKAEAEAKEEE